MDEPGTLELYAAECWRLTQENTKLKAEVARLDGLLKEIEEHPHCSQQNLEVCLKYEMINHLTIDAYRTGCREGHRCCAEIARRRHG